MKKIGLIKQNRFKKIMLLSVVGLFSGITSITFGQSCLFDGGGIPVNISDGDNIPAYSAPDVAFPQTCDDISTTLTCLSGTINGNQYAYPYSYCEEDMGAPIYDVDLILDAQTIGGENKVAQYSSPTLNISITNRGTETLSANNIAPGFLQCERNEANSNINIYQSRLITSFVANPIVPQNISIVLNDIFTQSLGNKTITCYLNKDGDYYNGEGEMNNNTRTETITVVKADRFDLAMERAIQPIKQNLEAPEITSALGGAETIKNFIFKKVMDVLVPLVIVIGILTAILGFYKMFFSTEENSTKEGVKYIAYGLIGIILIMSAKFIGTTIFETILSSGVTVGEGALQGWQIAQQIYEKLAYPFIKLAMYLVLGVMFIVLVGRTLSFLFGTDEEAKKKAGTIIGRNIIAMILIIGAKQIVEAIYGKSGDVVRAVSNLGEIGTGILADKNIPILYQIINRAMGFISLAILIIIIFQTVQLLMKPDNADQMKSLKNSLLYIFIGLLIIGAGYLITNFLIIN